MVKGKPGRLVELRKTDIRIPHEYQRFLSRSRAARIARDFDWFEFGVLIVAHRNGEYFVVDGQHRLNAALQLPCVDMVPCLLYDFEGPQHEAEVFALLQLRRKPLVTRDLHRAELFVGGEFGHAAQRAQQFIDTLQCESVPLSTIRQLWKTKPAAFERIEALLPELVGTATLRKDFIEAIVYLEDALDAAGEGSLADMRARLIDVGYDQLVALMIRYEAENRDTVSKIASPRMKAEALKWALANAPHMELVSHDGETIGARVIPPNYRPTDVAG